MAQYCDELTMEIYRDDFTMEDECDGFEMLQDGEDDFRMWQGLVGPHFTPSVNADGDLSWTNNGGLPNPSSVNIKGEPGQGLTVEGIVSTVGDLPPAAEQGDVWLVGSESPYEAYIWNNGAWISLGEVAVGPAGPPGADGTTFTPTVSSAGVISWTNDGGKQNPASVNIKGPQGDPAPLPVHFSTTLSSLPATISDARILADTSTEESRVTDVEIATPSALASDLSWTTASGSVTFSGTMVSGGTTVISFNITRCEKQ